MAKKKMLLVDGSNHAFRVHFALPPMHTATGFPTRVLYGFTTLFAKMVRVHQPDYVAVSFDSGQSFRHERYPDYKGHRPEMPEDLALQWPHLTELVEAFGYKCVAVRGFEADDVLGTLAMRFASAEVEVQIVTGDRDFFQLLGDDVRVLDMMKEEEIGPAEVLAKIGVGPERIVDMKALSGDSSDNLPGVPGVGEKTAVKYLQQYGDLEGVLAHTKEIGGKRGQAIAEHADAVRLFHELATIVTTVPTELTLEELVPQPMQEDRLREMFDVWDFGKVARKLLPERQSISSEGYRVVTTEADLDALVRTLRAAGRFALDLDLTSQDPVDARIVGVAFSWSASEAAYVALGPAPGITYDPELALARVHALLADPGLEKLGFDLKPDVAVCRRDGAPFEGLGGDTILLDYVLAAHERSHALGELSQRYLGHNLAMVAPSGTLPFARPLEEQAKAACESAHLAWILHERLVTRLDPGSRHVYEQIEVPLVPVLADMELAGIRVDPTRIEAVRADLAGRMAEAERRCQELAGRPINVNSRHDIAAVLFDGGAFTPTKKVKDGWSTDSSVLEKIAEDGNLPAAILEYRQLQKLVGTYLDKLPTWRKVDGRIHTTFNQAVAATGRLSSQDPNLQNIPIRSFEGRRIRDCFVPDAGHVFVSADYSQIELRILAHLTGEPALIESFRRGEDIHRRTASEVFGAPIGEVTNDQRNAAKAINFGLMYGMSSFRLSNDLQITRDEAAKYMEEYFGRYQRVTAWIDETKVHARKTGHVETLYGRRRVLPTMHSPNYAERMAAEREAVNSRVQGTAADIIKIAMLRVARMLRVEGFQARLLLQVHDELLLEVPEAEVARLQPRLVTEMEAAADLLAPLRVNSATGLTWNEAHG